MKLCINIKDCIEIIKSYGIRDRSGLVPRKVPVKGKYGYYTKTVYVRPELVENPYKHKLEEHPEEYREDLPKLLEELSNFKFDGKDERTVFEMTRKMGKANNMAIKGNHLRLNDEEKEVNDKIYAVKRDFCENLAEYYVKNKLNCKWLVVEEEKNYDGSCLYVRDSKTGIQISFHGYTNEKGIDIPITNDPHIWDGVLNSFEYTADEYKKAREQKGVTENFKKEYREFFENYFSDYYKDTIAKLMKSKRVDKMIQEDIKNGKIKSKDDIKVDISLSLSNEIYRDDSLFVDDFLKNSKKALLKIKVVKKNGYGYLPSSQSIEPYIMTSLEKLGIAPHNVMKEKFDEVERSFILEENN